MSLEIKNISVRREDIFDYVVKNSTFDPIEKCIDPSIYETYSDFILQLGPNGQEYIYQDEDYIYFHEELEKLRSKSLDMSGAEIMRLCEELEEIAPKTVKL